MKILKEELEEVVDRHVKNPPKPSDEVVSLVNACALQFGGHAPALAVCLAALGHALKHAAHTSQKLGDETIFLEMASDPIIKMMSNFPHQILTCKRFK